MEQRRLRLGDILDDYCPRERRVTNHAVVAMIEEDIKQTRCTTCDAEHAYKGARVPKRRKKETASALYNEVLAGMPDADRSDGALVTPGSMASDAALPADPEPEHDPEIQAALDEPRGEAREELRTAPEPEPEDLEPGEENVAPTVDGPVHRRLIRATLPRPEGQKDARPLPEFTVRQSPTRGNGNAHGHHGHSSFRGERLKMRGGGNGYGTGRFNGHGNRSSGRGGQGQGGFRGGNAGPGGKRGRGSRG